jgi:hypothetical protein
MKHLLCTFHTLDRANLWLYLWNHFLKLNIVCKVVRHEP